MRKVLISLVIVTLMLTFPIAPKYHMAGPDLVESPILEKALHEEMALSSAGGSGNLIPAVQYVSRTINGKQIAILNTYADTTTHSGEIDLTGYLNPGWHLYKVTIDVNSMTAAPEREVVGKTYQVYFFQIANISGTWYSQLAQGFFNQSFNGALLNYSIYYSTSDYDPPNRGNASVHINSGYLQSGSFVDPVVLTSKANITDHDSAYSWATFSGENIQLNESTVYWAIMNGTLLKSYGSPVPTRPTIYWGAENSAGAFESWTRGYSSWDYRAYEAMMRYAFIPWNRTAGAPLEFPTPESLSLLANSSAQTGLSWTFTNATNDIASIQFNTNQSVYLDYNITVWYQSAPTVTTNWHIDVSGNPVMWNATTSLTYPVFAETTTRYLDITIQPDWSVQGLYNSTNPGTDYGHNSRTGDVVTCTEMADEVWTLSCSAPNYVTDIALSDSSDSSPITYYVDILVDMDIDATIDGGGPPITTGSTNLTIIEGGSTIWAPLNKSVFSGAVNYLWNIDSTTSGNGTHYIEIFWSNGTEAGYLMAEVFVYYPTTLVSDDSVVNAYAENAAAFSLGIDFDRIFPVGGMDSSFATVTYSFESVTNASLTDQGGGRWTATISTVGISDGTYSLYVYAEGYALENHSITVTVNLIYQTQALNESWSNGSNIAYLDHTNLSMSYIMQDGITRIPGATVNVTFQGQTFDMAWNPSTETYWIDLTGENFTGVPGTFDLNVSAWKAGYEAQYKSTITITIGSQTGETFSVVYNPATLNISYIESLFIQVTYEYNTQPLNVTGTVIITFNGSSPVVLDYNSTSQRWETTLKGSSYFGTWSINVTASATGYTTRYNTTTFIVHEDNPIFSTDIPGFQVTTDYGTDVSFSLFVTDSIGTPINDANVSFTAFGLFHSSASGTNGEYSFTISPWTTRGPHEFTVFVTRTGYATSEMNLTITVEATTSLEFQLSSYQEYEQWNITINALYMDSFHSTPIINASVNITLDGKMYYLEYVGYYYQANITLNLAPGDYTIDAVSSALYAVSGSAQTTLTVTAKRLLHIDVTFDPPRVVAGQFMQVKAKLTENGTDNAVSGYTIRFEISIFFTNGTSIHYGTPDMFDTTNTEGLATWGFDVPEGQIDQLTAIAIYSGDRENWSVETTESTGVGANVLSLLFAFLMSDIGIMIIISMALLGIVAAGYNRGIKPKKRAAKLSLENQLQMFEDLETVQHFMAVYLDRGTCVFYHPFTDERIQPDLISGFIAAITSVYGEIKGDGVRGTLEEIQYHGLRLNSYSGQYIIGILILEGEMTPLLRERLQFFVELFENQYEKDLDGWTGLVDCFDPEWVVSTLNSAFNYAWHLPHRFGPTQKVSKTDARILDYISAVRDERSEFYLKNLLAPLAEMLEKTEAEVLDRLLYLQDRGIIVPIGVQTILQRQGLALVNGSGEQAIQPPPAVEEPPSIEEKPKGKGKAKAKEEPTEAAEELQFDEITEVSLEEPHEEVVEKPETEEDAMEAFVQDVESLLVSKSKEEKKEDDGLDKFVKELRAKIGEDEDEESKD